MNAKLDSGVTTRPVTRQTFDEVLVPTYAPAGMVPVRASGLDVWDQEGKHYLDFTSGIAVSSLGHANPVLVDALTKQLNTLWHLGNGYTNEPVLRLALALTEATFADRAFFCNSGAEANEAALKLARKYAHTKFGPHKSRIISCLSSFHGRTLFTVSVGGQPKYTEGFEPLPQFLRRRQVADRFLQPQHAHASGRQHAVLERGVTPRLVFIAASVSVDLEGEAGLAVWRADDEINHLIAQALQRTLAVAGMSDRHQLAQRLREQNHLVGKSLLQVPVQLGLRRRDHRFGGVAILARTIGRRAARPPPPAHAAECRCHGCNCPPFHRVLLLALFRQRARRRIKTRVLAQSE